MKLSTLLLLAQLSFAASLESSFQSKFEYSQSTNGIKALSYELWDEVPLSAFKNKDASIYLEQEETMLLQRSSLNTASRSLPNNLFNFEFYDSNYEMFQDSDKENYWFEFRSTNVRKLTGPLQPVTGCLNQEHGDGGALVGTFTKGFGKTSSFDLQFGFTFNDTYKIGADYSYSIGSSVTLETSYSCSVPANSTGQIFYRPLLMRYEEPRYRQVTVFLESPWYNPLKKEPVGFQLGDWKTTDSFEVLDLKSNSMFSCVIDPKLLDCSLNILGDSWVKEFS